MQSGVGFRLVSCLKYAKKQKESKKKKIQRMEAMY